MTSGPDPAPFQGREGPTIGHVGLIARLDGAAYDIDGDGPLQGVPVLPLAVKTN